MGPAIEREETTGSFPLSIAKGPHIKR